MYFSYTGKYFRMYFQEDSWKNKKREQGSAFFPKLVRGGQSEAPLLLAAVVSQFLRLQMNVLFECGKEQD